MCVYGREGTEWGGEEGENKVYLSNEQSTE